MSGASKLALCFNPRQMYQFIDGIWKDIQIVIRDPVGATSSDEEPFTFKNVKDSFLFILKDLGHFGTDLSLGEAINM